MEPRQGFEPCSQPYQGCGSPSILTRRIWRSDSNRLEGVTSASCCHQHLARIKPMEPPPGHDPGPRGYKPRNLPINRQRLTADVLAIRRMPEDIPSMLDSNQRFRHLGADNGIEAVPQPWQGCILPLYDIRKIWSDLRVTLPVKLVWKTSASVFGQGRLLGCYSILKRSTRPI